MKKTALLVKTKVSSDPPTLLLSDTIISTPNHSNPIRSRVTSLGLDPTEDDWTNVSRRLNVYYIMHDSSCSTCGPFATGGFLPADGLGVDVLPGSMFESPLLSPVAAT